MKRHAVLPEPDLAPDQVVAEEKTSWLAPFGKNYVFVTILLLVVMALGYAGIVYGAASQSFLFLSLSRGYSAGFVFALVSWSGVVSSIVYLLNAFFGGRIKRRWVQLFGAVLFPAAGGRLRDTQHRGHGHHVPHCGRRRHLVAMEHARVRPQQLPDPDALPGRRLDRRHRAPRAWGGVLIAGQLFLVAAPRNFILFVTIPCAILPGHPSRHLREEPAPPRAGRTVPIDAGPPALGSRPPALSRGVSGGPRGVTGGPAHTTAGLPPVLLAGGGWVIGGSRDQIRPTHRAAAHAEAADKEAERSVRRDTAGRGRVPAARRR